ncbi:MAG: tRNA uridine-5-carboxymethylaminomethyl(34) synthesis enzyme MnmG, partial [Erysipelotrichaceae bacterium]|nr:tRNA uridine-5-carboxymethylaminomethyl(34) synthesis enzyme MnmG [Erysipelotrichaceae bacterium]
RYETFLAKIAAIASLKEELKELRIEKESGINEYLNSLGFEHEQGAHNAYELLKRPGVKLSEILDIAKKDYDKAIADQAEIEIKYEGYILKARKEADRMLKMDAIALPEDADYLHIDNLALEARQKLDKIHPASLGQASRISGINPSDIQVLAIWLKQNKNKEEN